MWGGAASALFGIGVIVGYIRCSHRKIIPCDKCGPNGVIDQYYWNYCPKCGRELHTKLEQGV